MYIYNIHNPTNTDSLKNRLKACFLVGSLVSGKTIGYICYPVGAVKWKHLETAAIAAQWYLKTSHYIYIYTHNSKIYKMWAFNSKRRNLETTRHTSTISKKTSRFSLLKVAQQPKQGRLSIGLAPRVPTGVWRQREVPKEPRSRALPRCRQSGWQISIDQRQPGEFRRLKKVPTNKTKHDKIKQNKTNKQTNKKVNKPINQLSNTRLDITFWLWSFWMPWAGVSANGRQIYRFPNKSIEMIRICSRPWPHMFILTEPKKFRKWILKIPSLETNIAPQNGWLED